MTRDEARGHRAKDIAAQFPITEAGMKKLADRCAWAEIQLGELLREKEAAAKAANEKKATK